VAIVALVVLAGRALAYSLTPASPAAKRLLGQLGGPGPVLVAVTALGLAVVLGTAVLWLGSIGAAERAVLAGAPVRKLRLKPVLLRAVALFVASALAFAVIESYVHYRDGLGFHGLHCLLGPVHRDALPLLAALSLLASAMHGAAGHLVGAVERAAGRLVGARARPREASPLLLIVLVGATASHRSIVAVSGGARAPPASS
jgi:hypothetical protein